MLLDMVVIGIFAGSANTAFVAAVRRASRQCSFIPVTMAAAHLLSLVPSGGRGLPLVGARDPLCLGDGGCLVDGDDKILCLGIGKDVDLDLRRCRTTGQARMFIFSL